MRKTLSIVPALSVVFAVSLAYACGEKRSSADANMDGAELTTSSKLSGASRAEVTAAVSNGDQADISSTSGYSCGAKVDKANVSKASRASVMKTQKASVKNADSKGTFCPASPSCTTPCIKDANVKKASVSMDSETDSEKMASMSDEVAPEANTLE